MKQKAGYQDVSVSDGNFGMSYTPHKTVPVMLPHAQTEWTDNFREIYPSTRGVLYEQTTFMEVKMIITMDIINVE